MRSYKLIEIATGKTVLNGTTFSRASYDIPGQQQRFARARAMRDAEDRAAQEIAENIRPGWRRSSRRHVIASAR